MSQQGYLLFQFRNGTYQSSGDEIDVVLFEEKTQPIMEGMIQGCEHGWITVFAERSMHEVAEIKCRVHHKGQ